MKSKILFYLLIFIHTAYATDYYVDALLGDDDNSGNSPNLAWQTIDKVNSIDFLPGDNILFHKNQSWIGSLIIDNSGNGFQPIRFSSYGEGEHPNIRGSFDAGSNDYWTEYGDNLWRSASSFSQEISVIFYDSNEFPALRANKEYSIANLDQLWDFYYEPDSQEVIIYSQAGNPSDVANGIEIALHDNGVHVQDDCSNITISNLMFSCYTNNGIYAHIPDVGLKIENNIFANIGGPGSEAFHGNGIFINALYPNDNFRIINNNISNIWHIGIFVPAGPTITPLYESQICNNTITYTGGSAIGVRYAIGMEVSDNYIHKASVYIPDRCGIGLENCDYIVVNNNVISEAVDDGSSPYGGWLSAGIYTFGANHSKFYYNIVSEGMVGIHLDDDDGTYGYTSIGNEVCYNLCYNFTGIGIMVEQENDSTLVYNNTTYDCLYAGISFRGYAAGNSDNCSIKNNIICNSAFSNNVVEIADIGTDFQMDYNCIFHFDPSANLIHWLGNNYTASEFEMYQNASGQDSNSIIQNPLFVNINSWDFTLSGISPCIDAGDPMLPLDPDGTLADMGAYYFDQGTNAEDEVIQTIGLMLNNYPNPFNPTTTISFSLQYNSAVELSIYNIKGQKIRSLTRNDLEKGSHSIIWSGDDESGNPLGSGIYFYKLDVNGKTESVKKCMLLK